MNLDWLGYQLYLFDLDDTLIQTRMAIRHSWRQTLQHPSLQGRSVDEWIETLRGFTRLYGTTADREYWQAFAVEATEELLNPHPLAEELRQIYRTHYWQVLQPPEHLSQYLQRLQQEQRKLALITNGLLGLQTEKLTAVGFAPYFQGQIYCSDQYEWAHQKPSPHMLYRAMEQANVSPEQTIFFGNATIDILAGNLAGITTVAVAEFENPQQLRLLEPDYRIHSWPHDL